MNQRTIWKIVRGFTLGLWVTSIFLPWLSESCRYFIIPYVPQTHLPPPFPREILFWSFQTLIEMDKGYAYYLLFCDYWFVHSKLYLGWFWVFVFQIITATLAFISTLKEKIKGKQFHIIATTLTSLMALSICIYQRFKQAEMNEFCINSQFSTGFWLAAVSTVIFFLTLLIASWIERKASKSQQKKFI